MAVANDKQNPLHSTVDQSRSENISPSGNGELAKVIFRRARKYQGYEFNWKEIWALFRTGVTSVRWKKETPRSSENKAASISHLQ